MKKLPRFIRTTTLLGLFVSITSFADTFLIDVRTPEEFAEAHADNAENIPYDEIGEQIANLTKNKDDTIYLYCRSGRRADIAAEILEKLGYKNVTNLGTLQDAQAADIDLTEK